MKRLVFINIDKIDSGIDAGDFMLTYFDQFPQSNLTPFSIAELRRAWAEYSLAEGEEKFSIFDAIMLRAKSEIKLKYNIEYRYIIKLLQNSLRIGVARAGIENILLRLSESKIIENRKFLI